MRPKPSKKGELLSETIRNRDERFYVPKPVLDDLVRRNVDRIIGRARAALIQANRANTNPPATI